MLERLFDLFEHLVHGDEEARKEFSRDDMRLAAAALLMHAVMIDGVEASEERTRVFALLEDKYGLGHAEAASLVHSAEVREKEAVDLYGFTRVLTRHLDQDGRKEIIEMLWEVVLADGVIHEFEANLVWRVAELLGVSRQDRLALRRLVEARQP